MPVQIPKVWKCMPFLSISFWMSNFVQHRLQVCLVIISWRMWRQMAQKAAARVSVRGVLQNNCSIARICSNTNITSEQFFVRVPRMVPRGRMPATLCISPAPGAPWHRVNSRPGAQGIHVSPHLSENIISKKNIFKYFQIFSKRYVLFHQRLGGGCCVRCFFVGSYDGREEEKSVTYRAAGSGRGAIVSALCPDRRTLDGK